MADLAIRREIVGSDQVARVDVGPVDELIDLDRPGRIQRQLLELLLGDLDVLSLVRDDASSAEHGEVAQGSEIWRAVAIRRNRQALSEVRGYLARAVEGNELGFHKNLEEARRLALAAAQDPRPVATPQALARRAKKRRAVMQDHAATRYDGGFRVAAPLTSVGFRRPAWPSSGCSKAMAFHLSLS
jgi:hypothetical protein